jgi:intracellular septation protein
MKENSKNKFSSISKFFSDYLPLIVFFIAYKFSNKEEPLLFATSCLIVSAFFSLIVCYFLTKKIALMPLFSALILGIFGGLTIFLKDDFYIKIKPTIINLIFASILFYGYFSKKPLLSYLIGDQIKISKEAWLTLSLRWAFLFIFLAILNEFIWRFFSTDFWVQFKVFGMTPISMIFAISQIPFIIKEMKKQN